MYPFLPKRTSSQRRRKAGRNLSSLPERSEVSTSQDQHVPGSYETESIINFDGGEDHTEEQMEEALLGQGKGKGRLPQPVTQRSDYPTLAESSHNGRRKSTFVPNTQDDSDRSSTRTVRSAVNKLFPPVRPQPLSLGGSYTRIANNEAPRSNYNPSNIKPKLTWRDSQRQGLAYEAARRPQSPSSDGQDMSSSQQDSLPPKDPLTLVQNPSRDTESSTLSGNASTLLREADTKLRWIQDMLQRRPESKESKLTARLPRPIKTKQTTAQPRAGIEEPSPRQGTNEVPDTPQGETFNHVITDIENLLQEALQIAEQASHSTETPSRGPLATSASSMVVHTSAERLPSPSDEPKTFINHSRDFAYPKTTQPLSAQVPLNEPQTHVVRERRTRADVPILNNTSTPATETGPRGLLESPRIFIVASDTSSDSEFLEEEYELKPPRMSSQPSSASSAKENTGAIGLDGRRETMPYGFDPSQRDDSLIPPNVPQGFGQRPRGESVRQGYSLKKRGHVTIQTGDPEGFGVIKTRRRHRIPRDWTQPRKRIVALVACVSAALIGLVVGIYAGEVPAIQYTLADEHHYVIVGNVVFYIGIAISTIVFWPLPLLHGRKPYNITALAILLLFQLPQAVIVQTDRSPNHSIYRIGLLLSRAGAGIAIGFANINLQFTLLDLFGASLQSSNPNHEFVNQNDMRRHGGGMGAWLGIWTWSFIGSIGVGFLIGASIISGLNVSWGFWIVSILIVSVLLLNVIAPEVRRSANRRSYTEVQSRDGVARRLAKGEVKMHLYSIGPRHWWEEVQAGLILSIRMLKQPAFLVVWVYLGWIYGQVVLIVVVSQQRIMISSAVVDIKQLLGALTSKYYRFHPTYVGLCVFAVPLGALIAVPFQRASIFSRSRVKAPRTDSLTFVSQITWTSHTVRRVAFTVLLPLAGLAYTLTSTGPPLTWFLPTFFAGVIGFLSNLAIAECNALIMETFDTSDLQPGMVGRPRMSVTEDELARRTNYSCYPRVSAGFALSQGLAFLIAAITTGVGGSMERRLGAQAATGVMAGILLILTLLLIGVLWRYKEVQLIPEPRFGGDINKKLSFSPVVIGVGKGKTRRMNLLEMSTLSRWSEIRRRNRLGSFG